MNTITTPRLLLRRLQPTDRHFIVQLLNSDGWLRYIGDRKVRTETDALRYLEEGPLKSYQQNDFGLMAIVFSGEPIGLCGLLKRDYLDHPDLGFALLPAFERKGFAFEAAQAILAEGFGALKLQKVLAICLPENLGSIRLLKRLGFEYRDQLQRDKELLASFELRSEVFLTLSSLAGPAEPSAAG